MQPLIPSIVTSLLILYAYLRNALTTRGIIAAAFTAAAHAVHPWSVWFALLCTFFLTGTLATKLKQAHKATLTASAEPSPPPKPGQKTKSHARSATQVFCNSLPATLLILVHALYLEYPDYLYGLLAPSPGQTPVYDPHDCLVAPTSKSFQRSRNIAFPRSFVERILNTLPYAILALYSTAAADTFASELGIVSQDEPILLTDLIRFRVTRVPKGTNGGVTLLGVVASAFGASIISGAFVSLIPLCLRQWDAGEQIVLSIGTVVVGAIGAALDSLLGAWCQASIVDISSGKIVESAGGGKIAYKATKSNYEVSGKPVGRVEEKRKMLIGKDLLSNNGVNLVTGLLMALGTIVTVLNTAG